MITEAPKLNATAIREVLERARKAGRTALGAADAKIVADAAGIPVPKEALASSADEAARLAGEIGFPVVMKIVSPDILHKTESGGVVTGVADAASAREAYAQIVSSARRRVPGAAIDGVQVQQQLAAGQED